MAKPDWQPHQQNCSAARRPSLLRLGVALPLSLGAMALCPWIAPANANPSHSSNRTYQRIYRPAPSQPSVGISVQIGSPYPNEVYVNRGYGYRRGVNDSVLINPTIVNSPIYDSTVINPTIVTTPYYPAPYYPVPLYPGVSTLTIQTYTRPSPEIIVDPQYGVRFKNPPGY